MTEARKVQSFFMQQFQCKCHHLSPAFYDAQYEYGIQIHNYYFFEEEENGK